MQQLSVHLPPAPFRPAGGRIGSVALRRSYELSQEFAGLEEGVDRFALLILVKRAGTAAGFSAKMIQLLDYYMAFTREADWEEGSRPVVYQSLARTALDLGVSERQIQRLEQGLFAAGAITFNDSGNHKRYGQRCPKTGRILYAFGVELSPLAQLKPELEVKLAEKEAHDQQWLETKRQISWYRRQICAGIAEAEEGGHAERGAAFAPRYQSLAVPIRTYMDLAFLGNLLTEHKALHGQILAELAALTPREEVGLSDKASPTDDTKVAHYNSTTQKKPFDKSNLCRPEASCSRESVAEPVHVMPESVGASNGQGSEQGAGTEATRTEEVADRGTGLEHISLKQALNAASERFRAHLPMESRPLSWADLVEAAFRLKCELHVSQQNWAEACATLGRNGAAVCLLLTDRATQRDDEPVLKPGAYFRAMINRAKDGDLRLHAGVMGILIREQGATTLARSVC
ncbi:MAG: plasmid replication protein RepC [Opitutaceae bacterium]